MVREKIAIVYGATVTLNTVCTAANDGVVNDGPVPTHVLSDRGPSLPEPKITLKRASSLRRSRDTKRSDNVGYLDFGSNNLDTQARRLRQLAPPAARRLDEDLLLTERWAMDMMAVDPIARVVVPRRRGRAAAVPLWVIAWQR